MLAGVKIPNISPLTTLQHGVKLSRMATLQIIDSNTAWEQEQDREMVGKISAHDPFLFSIPCWKQHIIMLLPLETVSTIALWEKNPHMPIEVIASEKALPRMFKRSGITSKSEFGEIMTAVNNLKADQSINVKLNPDDWKGTKKPEVTLANTLRRKFEFLKMNATAYQVAANQIVVRLLTQTEIRERNMRREAGSKKGKGKK